MTSRATIIIMETLYLQCLVAYKCHRSWYSIFSNSTLLHAWEEEVGIAAVEATVCEGEHVEKASEDEVEGNTNSSGNLWLLLR